MSDTERLCYIEGAFAWFTSHPKPWGDDWNDSPHDCNAGPPYARFGPFTVVAFDGEAELVTGWADDNVDHWAQNVSVEDCNAGRAPWLAILYGNHKGELFGRATLDEFRAFITSGNGHVYVREDTDA